MNDQNDVGREDVGGRAAFPDAPRRRRLLAGGIAAAPVILTVTPRSALANFCPSPSRAFSGNVSGGDGNTLCNGLSPGYWSQPQKFNCWPAIADPPTIQRYIHEGWYNDTSGSPSQTQFEGSTPSYRIKPEGSTVPHTRFALGTLFEEIFNPSLAFDTAYLVQLRPCDTGASRHRSAPGISLWELLAFANSASGVNVQLARHCVAAYFNALSIPSYPMTPAQVLELWHEVATTGCWSPNGGACSGFDATYWKAYIEGTFGAGDPTSCGRTLTDHFVTVTIDTTGC